VNANPKVTVEVSQDAGEESIDGVTFTIPAGFKLPGDAAIKNGETLGQGKIQIAIAPACNKASQQTLNATVKERDRTAAEKSKGVKAVWVFNIQTVNQNVDLLISGSAAKGWTIKGKVPANSQTCPPFSLTLAVDKTSSDSGTMIWGNPSKAGKYTLKAAWTSTKGSHYSQSQTVTIKA
jgi:hypothetical protein